MSRPKIGSVRHGYVFFGRRLFKKMVCITCETTNTNPPQSASARAE